MILLPLLPGLATLGLLLPGLDVGAWPLLLVGLLLLACSLPGRWPAAATLFCATVVGLTVTQRVQSIFVDVGVGLFVAAYLLMIDATESLSSLVDVPDWLLDQPSRVLAACIGVGAVALAVAVPVISALPTLVAGTAATAVLFVWVMSTSGR